MRILTCIILAVVLAGCGDKTAPAVESDFKDAQTDANTGAVSGVVVDAAIVPVAGATVLLHDGTQATTDADGTFVFERLEPGTYFLTVEAPLFNSTQSSVDVTAGAITTVRIQLIPDLSPQPYHVTYPFQGHIESWGGIASFVLQVFAPELSGCVCELEITPDMPAASYVLEVTWDESVTSPVGHAGYYWELDQSEPELIQTSGYGENPILAHVSGDTFTDQERMMARFTGPDEWIALDQSFEMYVTVFYLDPAPEGWSFVAGDA